MSSARARALPGPYPADRKFRARSASIEVWTLAKNTDFLLMLIGARFVPLAERQHTAAPVDAASEVT